MEVALCFEGRGRLASEMKDHIILRNRRRFLKLNQDIRNCGRISWSGRANRIRELFRIHFFYFNILLTVHLSTTLINDQLDAQFLYSIIRLLQSSTCFEQRYAHHQEVNCINIASGIVTLCKWLSGMQVEKEPVPSQPAYRTATYRE